MVINKNDVAKFIRLSDWERCRHLFTEVEKATLNFYVVGEVVCPRGVMVAVVPDTIHLLAKIK